MSVSTDERTTKRLVDMEFRPGELSAAEAVLILVRQTQALRRLKSAERAREMASRLARLDSAGSGTRQLAVLQALYAGNPILLGRLRTAASAIQRTTPTAT